MSSDEEDQRDFIRALARGLEVIELFDLSHPSMTLAELAMRAGLSRGTVRRILITLEQMGYVEGTDGRFKLMPRALRLGYAYLSATRTWDLARPYLEMVKSELGESSSIAVLDGFEIVFVARVAANRLVRDYIPIGLRWPAYPTSLGRVLLSGLPDQDLDHYFATTEFRKLTEFTLTDSAALREKIYHVRKFGWASADRDIDPNLRSVAVPVFDTKGRIIAAMNTNGQASVVTQRHIESHYVPVLQRAAKAFSEVISWQVGELQSETVEASIAGTGGAAAKERRTRRA